MLAKNSLRLTMGVSETVASRVLSVKIGSLLKYKVVHEVSSIKGMRRSSPYPSWLR